MHTLNLMIRSTVSLTEEDKMYLSQNPQIKPSRVLREALEILRQTESKSLNAALVKLIENVENGRKKS